MLCVLIRKCLSEAHLISTGVTTAFFKKQNKNKTKKTPENMSTTDLWRNKKKYLSRYPSNN